MATSSDIQISMMDTDALHPYPKNARKHSKTQVAQIAKSITEFGFTNPILIDKKNGILAGHGRVLAAIQLGMTSVPTIALAHLTKKQARAYIIADNKLAENATWNIELLSSELFALNGEGFDLSLMGFSDPELGRLLDVDFGGGGEDLDLPTDPKTKLGDLFELGQHRLICGDATDESVVARLLNGDTPHLMVTDPPYGVNYDPNWRAAPGQAGPHSQGSKRKRGAASGKSLNDHQSDWNAAWNLFPGQVVYVWHAGNMGHTIAETLVSSGFDIRAQIIWVKNKIVIGRGHYHPKHEPLLYAVRKGKSAYWTGDRKQGTVWEIDKNWKSETGHSTQKPIECMKRPMENNSQRGDFVYDPFVGSGTSIIAAEILNRRCLAIELDPAYCDLAIARWEAHTSEKAKRIGGGNGKA